MGRGYLALAGLCLPLCIVSAAEPAKARAMTTPSGIRFAILGDRPSKPAPTLFVFAGGAEETLNQTGYYNRTGHLLSRDGCLCVSLDLPCHGKDVKAGEAGGIAGWRTRLAKDSEFVQGFTKQVSGVLDYLIKEGYTAPDRVGAAGTSRGGFIALHWAAADARVGSVAAFAPVTDLLALTEFRGMADHKATRAASLLLQASKLAGRPVWVCIGNNDQRVSTDQLITLTRKIVTASAEQKKPAPVELHVMPTEGHRIHDTAYDEAATWFAKLWGISAPPKPAPNKKSAIEKALPLLAKGAEGHTTNRTCFGCHNQATAMLAFTTAKERGFTVSGVDIDRQLKFIADFLGRNRENYLKGKGQGGQVDTAGYALLTLEWGGWKPDATTEAVVEYLLHYHKDLDYWRTTATRPPSEVSSFTSTYVALRALRKWGTTAQKERIGKRIDTVRGWLLKTPAKDTEDRVFRLWALREAGADEKAAKEAVQELIHTQRKDGGWSQLDTMDSDAYATGSALVVLHRAGALAVSDPVYQRGVAYLVKEQKPDGSWYVRSRSKPFQTYFESGFPHGKDQFISMAASGWATSALIAACR